jgi:serine/threonine protein kinase
VLELIGAGGMGAVYKARQPKLGRLVALKTLSQDLAESPAFSERFNREARVLALLNHPNIVTVYDFGKQGGFFFLLMEYVDGVNLRQAMQAGRFSPSQALDVVPEICGALQFAHEEGILHRDIKPENILMDAKGRVKIADFGIAKLIGKQREHVTLTTGGAILGTPHYMAPEQLEIPGEVDHRADIYSLGVVFYEMLTGELPIGRFSPPSTKTPMDSRVDDVVMKALEKERKRRYQSAGEVKTNVEAITQSPFVPAEASEASSASSTQRIAGPPVPESNSSRWATWSAVLTGLSLLLAISPLLKVVLLLADPSGSSFSTVFWIMAFVSVAAATLGFFFGCLGLRDIRSSSGRIAGLTRCTFATLGWPLLVLISLTSISSGMGFVAWFGTGLLWLLMATLVTLTVAELVVLVVWCWAKCIPWWRQSSRPSRAIRGLGTVATITAVILLIPTLLILVSWGMFTAVPGERSQRTEVTVRHADEGRWLLGPPQVDFTVKVPPEQVSTFALVRSDSFKAIEVLNLQGYVIASDDRAFDGRVQLGALARTTRLGGDPTWVLRITDSNGGGGYSSGDLPGEWAVQGGKKAGRGGDERNAFTADYHATS